MLFQKRIFVISLLFIFSLFSSVMAVEPDQDDDFKSVQEIMDSYHAQHPTPCATKIFATALHKNADKIPEDISEYLARSWAKQIMQSPDVLTAVLDCPEVKNTPNTKTIVFNPVVFEFPNGRTLTINYTSQPKIMKQHIMLATRPSLPNNTPNPDLKNIGSDKYMNTEPAWYAIMVVQHDSLSEFVGENKNNTLSVKYINDHIDDIYPHGFYCTSKSNFANDNESINQAVKRTVNMEDDTNDYYVAGDVDLSWVMYAEIAADILLTVGTGGLGELGLIAAKAKNATRAAKNIQNSLKALRKLDAVKDYIAASRKIATHTDDIAKLTKYAKDFQSLRKEIDIARKAKDVAKAQELAKNAAKILKESQAIDKTIKAKHLNDATDIAKVIDKLKDSVKESTKIAENLVKQDKNVKLYKENMESAQALLKYRRALTALKRPQTGNIITRTLRALKASQGGAKQIAKTSKLARAGMSTKTAKIKDWLFEATLKHGARLARFERDTAAFYQVVKFAADMYDATSATSKEFSNGIEFKPLGLLFADDLKGQENVVNYGMWLMWEGNSTDPADDDAAYLQAMDFATKFAYNLNMVQEEQGVNCNVDIYVVRPIIKIDETDLNNPKGEMFYLFMNEIPWTTSDQFHEKITDIDKWEAEQVELAKQKQLKLQNIKEEVIDNNQDTTEQVTE